MEIDDWPCRRYGAILADPPWQFTSWSPAGDGLNANRHYDCLSLKSGKGQMRKIGVKVVRHGRCVTFQLAEVAIPRSLFANILRLIDGLRPAPLPP